jgi:hypothetical protein
LPVNDDPVPDPRTSTRGNRSMLPDIVAANDFPISEGERLPDGLEGLRLAPGTSVSVTRVRAERWTVTEAGGVVQRLERIETSHLAHPDATKDQRQSHKWLRRGAAIGIPAIVMGSVFAWAVRDNSLRTPRSASMMVAVPLFDDAVERAPSRASRPAQSPRPKLSPAPMAAAAAGPGLGAVVVASPLTEDAAIALAFSSNEPQQWSNGDASGWVVVGPPETVGQTVCRDVAVLTRIPGIADQTRNQRRCEPDPGTILKP